MPSLSLMKRRAQGFTAEGETYSNMDLSSMLAFGSKWKDCTFERCDLSLADFSTARFEDVSFVDCDFPLARFQGSSMRNVTFTNCRGKQAALAGVTPMDGVLFLGCQMQYSSFYDSTIRKLDFVETNLHGADLRFIDGGKNVSYESVVLWNASVQLGCQFLSGTFDERSADLFVAMVARRHPVAEKRRILEEMAGSQFGVISRLMDQPEVSDFIHQP